MMGLVPIDAALYERCRAIPTSTWSDALDGLGLSGVVEGIAWRSGASRIAGPAMTVSEDVWPLGAMPFEAFDVGGMLASAGSGAVIVIALTASADVSTFGGLAARAATARGIAGVIIDGGCRDIEEIRERGLFVASRHVTPRSGKRRIRVRYGGAITCGNVRIAPGDAIVADQTGIVVIPSARVVGALNVAEQLEAKDAEFASSLDRGQGFEAVASRLRHV